MTGSNLDRDEARQIAERVFVARNWPEQWREEALDLIDAQYGFFGDDTPWPSHPEREGWDKLAATFGHDSQAVERQEEDDFLSNVGQEVKEAVEAAGEAGDFMQKNRGLVQFGVIAAIGIGLYVFFRK